MTSTSNWISERSEMGGRDIRRRLPSVFIQQTVKYLLIAAVTVIIVTIYSNLGTIPKNSTNLFWILQSTVFLVFCIDAIISRVWGSPIDAFSGVRGIHVGVPRNIIQVMLGGVNILDSETIVKTRRYDAPTGELEQMNRPEEETYRIDPKEALSELNDYKFVDVIGEGGTSIIVRARTNDGTDVAVKLAKDKRNPAKQLIETEVEILERIGGSGHVTSFIDSGKLPVPWIAFEIIHDPITLRDALPVTVSNGCQIITQLFETIEYSHNNGITHGDLKPDNILVDRNGEIWVVDWGAAMNAMKNNAMYFTEAYAPPEFISRLKDMRKKSSPHNRFQESGLKPLSSEEYKKADIFQVGYIAYEILTGEIPFWVRGASDSSTGSESLPPSFVNETLPQAIDPVLLKALEFNPDDRYESISEFFAEFQSVIVENNLYSENSVAEPSIHPRAGERGARTTSQAKLYHNYASKMAEKGYSGLAERYYEAAIKLSPSEAAIFYDYANFLSDEERNEEAAHHYRQALDLEPNQPDIHNNYANVLADDGNFELAIDHYKKALELDPDRAETHNNLALILSKRHGVMEEAASHWAKALDLEPRRPEIHNNYAKVMADIGRTDVATDHYRKAIELDPDYAEAHYNYANLLVESGKKKEAERHFQRAIQIEPEYTVGTYENILKNANSITPSATGAQTTVVGT